MSTITNLDETELTGDTAPLELAMPDDTKTEPLALPLELMMRVATILDDNQSLSRLSRVNKDWYLAAEPRLFTTIGTEFHQIKKVFDLAGEVKEEERYLMAEKPDPEKNLEGHPIDWPYPKRLRWLYSHITKIQCSPHIEKDAKFGSSPFAYYEHTKDNAFMPRLDFICLDVRQWTRSPMDKEVYQPTFHLVPPPDILSQQNQASSLQADTRMHNLIRDIRLGLYPKRLCLSSEGGSLFRHHIILAQVFPFIDCLDVDTVIWHDFDSMKDLPTQSLPACRTLVIDFPTISNPRRRLDILRGRLNEASAAMHPINVTGRMLFLPWKTVSREVYGPSRWRDRLGNPWTDEHVKEFEDGVNEILEIEKGKAEFEKTGKPPKWEWGYIKGESGSTRCEGCDRVMY